MSELLDALQSALPDRYRVDKEVGRGGMATVFVADDTQLDRRVAIKVLHPDLASSLGADRFAREIRVLAQLSHPNILPVLDSGQGDGVLYYVMPFVEGESLRDRLTREHQLPIDDAIAITCEIANALSFAHAAGVIHRDIKPENILMSDGHAVVADFGIARLVSDGGEKLTMTGMSMGTAAYMSPEQSSGEVVDGRSDLYSLACLLYELLTGSPPFSGANSMAVMARHAFEVPPGIRIVRTSVPDELEAAVMQALEKSPADRFKTVGEFKRALLGEATTAYTARYTARHTAIRPAIARPPWWSRNPLAAGAVGLFAASGIIAVAMSGLLQADNAVPANASRVAVTYFTDAPGSDLRFLADALTEGVIEQLVDANLDVASSSAVRAFRGARVTADSIGRALDVGTVVRGSLEPEGDGVSITVQLWDALGGGVLESSSFHASMASPLQLQGLVAARVADLVRSRVGTEATLREQRIETTSAEAWTAFRRAEARRKEADSLLLAEDYERALAPLADADSLLTIAARLDPRWGDVLVRRGLVALAQATAVRRDPGRRAALVKRGIEDTERALALDRNDADALAARGDLLWFSYEHHLAEDAERTLALAESALKQAVRIDQDNAPAWATLSALHYRKPDLLAVINAANEALRADKYLGTARTIQARLFYARYNTSDWSGAMNTCDQGRRRFPDDPLFVQCRLFMYMADSLAIATPDVDSAWAYAAQMIALTRESARPLAQRRAAVLVAGALAAAGHADSARRVLDRARPTPSLDPSRSVIGWEAAVRVQLGEPDRAVDLLREYLAVNPEHRKGFASRTGWWWRDLQDHPRFRQMIAGG